MRVGNSLMYLSLDEMINDQTTTHTYLSGPEGLFAVVVQEPKGTAYIRYIHTDHLGSWNTISDAGGNRLQETNFDAWGNRRDPNTWRAFASTPPEPLFDRGFTGHEHLYGFNLINMNGRVYDPVVSRMLSPDNFVQAPDFSQSFNRYSYAWNNPLVLTDPSGEFIVSAIIIGAFINATIQVASGNVNNMGDFFTAIGIGALSGAAGGIAGNAVAGALGATTSVGGAIANGTLVGASGGFAGGFVGGAGNAWIAGANFGQGLQSGLIGGGYGAIGGAFLGGLSGGIQYQRQISVFQKGCVDLGVNGGDPVPATDQFLSDAQKAWYKDAPMNNVKAFTAENVPVKAQEAMNAADAPGSTVPTKYVTSGKLTGMSNVYFNKNLAFSTAKQLFFTLGHEFVHVSQFAALAGQSSSILTPDFLDMLDFHAYSYQNSIGGLQFNSFTREDILRWSTSYSQFSSMNYINFPWTSNHSFIYPF